jgi:hypothetical protein
MNGNPKIIAQLHRKFFTLIAMMSVITATSIYLRADTGTCGGQSITLPFTDVPASNVFFCSIAEAFFSGLTNGTSATAYSPSTNVPREQMAAFVTRTMDQSLKRGSRGAALNQHWTMPAANSLALTTVGSSPKLCQSDGADIWVANNMSGTVSRVRASDGKLLDTWTGATAAFGVLCAMGKVFVTGLKSPGSLYQIDPSQPPGVVTTLSSSLSNSPLGIAYDGQQLWTANISGSVSIITMNPISVTNLSTGFTSLLGIIYDGTNIWVTDNTSGSVDKLHELDSTGAIVQSVDVGSIPKYPAFDGTNIWVPNQGSNSISVVRATGGSAGTVLATLSGNGLNIPQQAAFDGERILVVNFNGDSVSLWKASDLTPLGTFPTGTSTTPIGACSDGLNFWIALSGTDELARF